jgi:hypothetical protein
MSYIEELYSRRKVLREARREIIFGACEEGVEFEPTAEYPSRPAGKTVRAKQLNASDRKLSRAE